MPAEGAVVYGDMPALQALPVGIQNVANARLANQQQQQAEAQRIAQMWRDNELEAADGQLWSNQLGSIEQKHIQEGQQLMQEGINPYESMDPRAVKYRRDRRNIEGLRAYRGATEKSYVGLMQEMRKNPDKYDPESVKALQDWISQGNVEEYYRSGAQLPGLQARFDINDALKGFTAPTSVQTRTENNRKITDTSIDRPAAERAIIGRIMSSPGGMRQLERITGGLPIQDVLSAPETLEENVAMYNALYEGDPQFRAALASQGINSQDDPRYRQVVENAAQRRVQAKQALNQQMDNWVSMSSSGLKLGRSETFDDSQERLNIAKQQLALSRQREARLEKEANESGTKDVSYRGTISVPVGSETSGTSGTVTLRNAINLNNTEVTMPGGDAFDMNSMKPLRNTPSISGKIVVIGLAPYDATTGYLLTDEQAKNNPNVEYRKSAQIKLGGEYGRDVTIPAEKLPAALSGPKQKIVNSFLSDDTDDTQQAPQGSNIKASQSTIDIFK